MNLLSVKPPTIPILLHKYLKVVAIVDATDPETKRLLDHFVVSEYSEDFRWEFYKHLAETVDLRGEVAIRRSTSRSSGS